MWLCPSVECFRQVDLALVLDMSGSTEDHHQMALMMSRRLVDRMDVGRQTRVALLSFADHCTTHFNFNTYHSKSQVMSAINVIPSHGRTNTQVPYNTAIPSFICFTVYFWLGILYSFYFTKPWYSEKHRHIHTHTLTYTNVQIHRVRKKRCHLIFCRNFAES